ncbi:MAG TPA: hypothetical protein VK524_19765 [Polyangiaceae bacterium]|nr:hypothetical protein [Polyangiaceae bacterium]
MRPIAQPTRHEPIDYTDSLQRVALQRAGRRWKLTTFTNGEPDSFVLCELQEALRLLPLLFTPVHEKVAAS